MSGLRVGVEDVLTSSYQPSGKTVTSGLSYIPAVQTLKLLK